MTAAAWRLMLVGIPNSPHLHHWARMIARDDTAILIVPSIAVPTSLPEGFCGLRLAEITNDLPPGIHMVRPEDIQAEQGQEDRSRDYLPLTHHFAPPSDLLHPQRLVAAIMDFQPHLLHAHETQMAGYVCLEAAHRIGERFPPWIMSNWGSDTSLYHKITRHRQRLQAVLERVQLFWPDCHRDYATAHRLGYRGPVVPALPPSGGMDVAALAVPFEIPPSRRRTLIIKGYHHWSGRALLALSAVALARRHLAGVRIRITAASPMVAAAAARLAHEIGLDVEVLPYLAGDQVMLKRLLETRAVLAAGISDGTPTLMLEAMAAGALPIQTSSACADEWLEDGRTGLIVSPHDTRQMADAVIRAMTDHALVDSAATVNRETVRRRWNVAENGPKVWAIYVRTMEIAKAEKSSSDQG